MGDLLDIDLEPNLPAEEPKAQPAKPARVRIYLEENDNIPPGGLYIGFNGASYKLSAGVEVDVPVGIIGILDDAIESVPVIDQFTRQVVGHREKRKYAYRLIGKAHEPGRFA